MNKLDELERLKAQVAQLEGQVIPAVTVDVCNLETEINEKFKELTTLAKRAGITPSIVLAGNKIKFDGYDWRPAYDSDWYSSSADC